MKTVLIIIGIFIALGLFGMLLPAIIAAGAAGIHRALYHRSFSE